MRLRHRYRVGRFELLLLYQDSSFLIYAWYFSHAGLVPLYEVHRLWYYNFLLKWWCNHNKVVWPSSLVYVKPYNIFVIRNQLIRRLSKVIYVLLDLEPLFSLIRKHVSALHISVALIVIVFSLLWSIKHLWHQGIPSLCLHVILSHLIVSVDVVLNILSKPIIVVIIMPQKQGVFHAQPFFDLCNESFIVYVDQVLAAVVLADDFVTVCALEFKWMIICCFLHVLADQVLWGVILESCLA